MKRPIHRRHALCCGAALAAGLFTGLFTGLTPRVADAVRNPCRGALPLELARHGSVLAALEGIDSTRLVDTHAHLLGTGDAGSGCTVHPNMQQWWHPAEVLRRKAIMNAACVPRDVPSVDRAFVANLAALAEDFPAGARWWLFAFDSAHDDSGRMRPDWTTFHVPNSYAAEVALMHSRRFDWVASIHPYRADALAALELALRRGAVAVKWLPSAMNIDLADPRCKPFYDRLAAAGLPLIVHCGEEKAVPGAAREELGNPLRVRHALARGVTVVVAHCASLGHALDTDRRGQPQQPAFDLFARLMDEGSGPGRLLGDISAVFQSNRHPDIGRTILARVDWHPRLLHGSDHPLPGVMPLFSPRRLQQAGLLADTHVDLLLRVREHNPLLFDFMLKRSLRWRGQGLPASVFEAGALRRGPATVASA